MKHSHRRSHLPGARVFYQAVDEHFTVATALRLVHFRYGWPCGKY